MPRLRAVPRAIALLPFLALASVAVQAQETTLKPVIITGHSSPPQADVTGFGDLPLRDLPLSATVVDQRAMEASGARRLADLTGFDPSVTDAYNAPGYWDVLNIRGYRLDNRFNYRREGLPISAETSIPLDNKDRLEILKGTSGIQAGTSAPGGLVNYVVKRPTESDLRSVRLEFTQRASLLGAVDLGGRFGQDGRFGYRLNVAEERLRPLTRDLDGSRSLVALAADWRLAPGQLFEIEGEWSRKRQPSQAGFSLLGSELPAVPDPNLNLNNQPSLQTTSFGAFTGTLRYTQNLSADWKWSGQLGTQRLTTDDYTAFPFGCSEEGNFDRFCSNGSFDYYDYRSVDERRRQDVAAVKLQGKAMLGGMAHNLSFGVLNGKVRDRLPAGGYNFVGTGDITGTAVVPADPSISFAGTNRDERSLEFSVQDMVNLNARTTAWLGVRHTRLNRASVASDGAEATSSRQNLTTPWLALSHKLGADTMAYASWGQGVESQVVPNNGLYTNGGTTLPALKSRQWEAGLKGGRDALAWQVGVFDIRRPSSNIDYCNGAYVTCTGAFDGQAHHRGAEGSLLWTSGPWRVGGSLMALHARREGSVLEPATNGTRPRNVPSLVARANAAWRIAAVPGLELQADVSHESSRAVVANGSLTLPAWTRLDAALHYDVRAGNVDTSWTLGVNNLTDRRYWKEAPYQFGHIYLYPGAPRTVRLTFTATL